MIYGFIILAVAYRFAMLAKSMRNEITLRRDGAVEHGALNSKILAAVHVAFYLAASVEGIVRKTHFDAISALGLAVYLFGAVMLFVVARLLGRLWTVKLLVARDHTLVLHPLFGPFGTPTTT
ncbi:hypothetical protein [Sphingomonas sp. S2-65]|uniref:hypothetical protein n=1 Tax=Sphingomonas sp. S2-65 TaxID=2903960 RepID=UPI001F36BFE8|nr:hypothetical protein [Sphingomonas sp. S2-65]UYY58050.1 hypothetical protein LZ586_15500 [Sphingomonas sp. S2-65]